MAAPPTNQTSSSSSHQKAALKLLPLVQLLCAALIVAGVPLWAVASVRVGDATAATLTNAGLLVESVPTLLAALSGLRVATACLTAAALLATAVALLVPRACGGGGAGGGSRGARGASGAATALAFLLQLLLVLLIGLFTAWLLGAVAAGGLLRTAASLSSDATKAATRAVDSANSLLADLGEQQLAALDSAPDDVKGSGWYRSFRSSSKNLNGTAQTIAASGLDIQGACAPGCVSLDFLAGLAGLSSKCVCFAGTIDALGVGVGATRAAAVPALAGLLLACLGAAGLALALAAQAGRQAAAAARGEHGGDGERRRLRSKVSGSGTHLSFAGGDDAAIDIGGGSAKAGAAFGAPHQRHHHHLVAAAAAAAAAAAPASPLQPPAHARRHTDASLLGGRDQHGVVSALPRV